MFFTVTSAEKSEAIFGNFTAEMQAMRVKLMPRNVNTSEVILHIFLYFEHMFFFFLCLLCFFLNLGEKKSRAVSIGEREEGLQNFVQRVIWEVNVCGDLVHQKRFENLLPCQRIRVSCRKNFECNFVVVQDKEEEFFEYFRIYHKVKESLECETLGSSNSFQYFLVVFSKMWPRDL